MGTKKNGGPTKAEATPTKEQVALWNFMVKMLGGVEQVYKTVILSRFEESPEMTLGELLAFSEEHDCVGLFKSLHLKEVISVAVPKNAVVIHGDVISSDSQPQLSGREQEILTILNSHGEGISRQRLALLTNSTTMANQHSIDRLEALGYIRKRRSSEVYYNLTHHGMLRAAIGTV